MDWLKNNHPAVITVSIFCLGFAVFLYASFSAYISYDAFWHLKMGQDLLSSGLSPWVDHYSYTFAGEPISSPPYLFQVLLAIFVSTFGSQEGFQLIKIFAFTLLMLAIYCFYRQSKASWQIIAVTLPYIFLFLLFRFNHIRPEIFDLALVVLALILYLKASESFSHKNLAAIVLLQFVWVNYHAPILGYVIFFGLFLDKAIALLRNTENSLTWQRWSGWGSVLFGIGFINPEIQHTLFFVLNISSDIGLFPGELQSTIESAPNSSVFALFWLISAYLVIALTIQRQYGLALVGAIFAFKSWGTFSLVPMAGVVIFLLLSYSVARVDFTKIFRQLAPGFGNLVRILAAVTVISGIYLSVSKAVTVNQNTNTDDLPHDIVSYLKKTHPQGGNIFNRMRDGGYLLYHLSPEFRIYIDGRTNVLYPIDFLNRYVALYSASNNESIAAEVHRYDIDFAVFPLELGLFQVADNSNPLAVEYVSKNFILMSTRNNNFPLASRIMYLPMCWRNGYRASLAEEFEVAKKILPEDSVLTPILALLSALNQSANPEQFFAATKAEDLTSQYQQRLLGYIALGTRMPRQAFRYFEAIDHKQSLDLLMMAYAALMDQKYDESESLVLVSLSDLWASLNNRAMSNNEKAIAVSLLEILKQGRSISVAGEKYRSQLAKELLENLPELKLPLKNVIPQGNCSNVFTNSITD